MSAWMISFTLWTECVNAYAKNEQMYDLDEDPSRLEWDFNAIFSKLTTGLVWVVW